MTLGLLRIYYHLLWINVAHIGMKKWKIENHMCWSVEDKAIKPNVKDTAKNKVGSATLLVELFRFISMILNFFLILIYRSSFTPAYHNRQISLDPSLSFFSFLEKIASQYCESPIILSIVLNVYNGLNVKFFSLKSAVHIQYYWVQYISKHFEIYWRNDNILWSVLNMWCILGNHG